MRGAFVFYNFAEIHAMKVKIPWHFRLLVRLVVWTFLETIIGQLLENIANLEKLFLHVHFE